MTYRRKIWCQRESYRMRQEPDVHVQVIKDKLSKEGQKGKREGITKAVTHAKRVPKTLTKSPERKIEQWATKQTERRECDK